MELGYLWQWFLELHAGRGSNGFGPNPLTYTEMAAWSNLTGAAVRASEVQALIVLDRLWLTSYAEQSKAQQAWREQQRKAKAPHGR